MNIWGEEGDDGDSLDNVVRESFIGGVDEAYDE